MIESILIPFGVFAGALALLYLLRNRLTAAQRHLVLVTSFAVVALVPAVAPLIPAASPAVGRIRSTVVMWVTADSGRGDAPSQPVAEVWATALTPEARSVALWIWVAGAALLLFRIGAGLTQRHRVKTVPAHWAEARVWALAGSSDVARRVRVWESAGIAVPETRGVVRPVILLPPAARGWNAERLDFVLTHELIHILRHDWLFGLMAELLTALHWYNPLAWRALHTLRQERELACDDEVLGRGIDGIDYAGHLVEIAAGPGCRTEAGAVAMAHVSNLETRVRLILRPDIKRGGVTMKGKLMAAGVAAVMVVLLSGMKAPAQGNAALSGTVQDPSGACVQGAVVLVRNTADRNKREIARTDDAGTYRFSALPPGRYEMEVSKPGFQLYRHDAIEFVAGSAQQFAVMLQVGRIAESVTITGTRPAAPANSASSGPPKRIRMGGNMQAAKLVKQIRPAYPAHLKEQGVEGTVLLEAVIGRYGKVINLQAVNSLVHADLIAAATEAVKQWEYEPTYLNGVPVEIQTSVQINYTLQK
ncbi:MAG: M56 family metallopeptidase [Bryobacteraceae bacterium]|nr:M56 family metallopeptidase [Bryobacteraceae bacterium]